MKSSSYYGLTIHQPWATMIAIGEKKIENRSWVPSDAYLGTNILIHAGREYDYLGALEIKLKFGMTCRAAALPTGAIVAVARLTDVVTSSSDPWFVGQYGWVLNDIIPIDPVTCAGNRSLWEPSQVTLNAVLERLKHPLDPEDYFRRKYPVTNLTSPFA